MIASDISTPSNSSITTCAGGSFSFTVNKSSDAAYNFNFVQSDHLDSAATTFAWARDTSTPDQTIDSNPSDPSSVDSATFTFSSTDGSATFECKLDTGSWTSCSSPQNYTGLGDGTHTFEMRATDTAGNINASTVDSITYTTSGGGGRHLHVETVIMDGSSNTLEAASVSAEIYLDGVLHDTVSSVLTDAAGLVKIFQINNHPTGTYTVTITDVTLTGYQWDGQTPANTYTK